MDKTLKNLSLGSGDFLVIQFEHEKYSVRDLGVLVGKLRSIFDPIGVKILLIPGDIELSSVHIHKGNGPPGSEYSDYWKKVDPPEKGKEVAKQYRMIRADVEEVLGIVKLASLPPNKKEMKKRIN